MRQDCDILAKRERERRILKNETSVGEKDRKRDRGGRKRTTEREKERQG